MQIDHVIYGVGDLDQAILTFAGDYGLTAMARSSHPEWGTMNAVVPLGPGQFLELLAIEDPTATSPLVAGLRNLLRDGDRMAGVCLRPVDLDEVAARLGLRIMSGERHEPGRTLRFRRTVVESDPGMPFFIDWLGAEAEMDEHYGREASTGGIAWVEVGAEERALRGWIGDADIAIRAVDGPRGARRFAVRRVDGSELVIQ